MNSTASYTPLETLLLFQALVAYGTEDSDFIRVSELLTNTPVVRDGETYDPQRLTVNALRDLYLHLLRGEPKPEEHEDVDSTVSKTRKLPSLSSPLKDAQDKLPVLVDQLFARYKDYMVRAIKEDDRRYASVLKDITEIERGEWDQRISEWDNAVVNGKRSSSSAARPTLNGIPAKDSPLEHNAPDARQETLTANGTKVSPTPTEARLESLPSKAIPISQPPAAAPKVSKQPPHGNTSQSQQQPRKTGPPPQPSPLSSREQAYGPPLQAPPYQLNGGGQSPPYYPNQYAAQQHPPRGSFSSPPGLLPPNADMPSSPINTHPHHANATGRATTSPGMPLDALADMAGQQQYRAPSGSPMIHHGPLPPAAYPPNYPPPQLPPSSSGAPQWNQQYIPPFQNQTPQQFRFSPNQRPPFPPQQNLLPSEIRQYNSPYNASQGPRPPSQDHTPKVRPSYATNTPISSGNGRFTTGSGTKWTPNPTGSTPRNFVRPEPPPVEPLSPVLRPPHRTDGGSFSKKKPQSSPQSVLTQAQGIGDQRTRAGSRASSVIAGSHRSQSVTSHADELSGDVNRHVKEEGDTTTDEASTRPQRHSTKRKRATSVRGSRMSSGPPTHVLWTRAFPKISASALETISGHRNASIFAAPVKEKDAPGYRTLILRPQDLKSIRSAITAGHRAATAAAPEDMGPGRSSVWLPISEDLIPPKGIINNTQFEKELMRMFSNAIMFNADPDRGLGQRWQGIGKDKGEIVGYAIDEDSVVNDTRAMFSDVEKIIGSLRSAEKHNAETRESSKGANDEEADELAGGGEVESDGKGSIAKRRRKG